MSSSSSFSSINLTTLCDDLLHHIWDRCALSVYNTCKIAHSLHSYTFSCVQNVFMAWRMVSNVKRAISRTVTPYSVTNASSIASALDRFDRKYKLLPLPDHYADYDFNGGGDSSRRRCVPYMLFKGNCGVAVRLRRHSDEDDKFDSQCDNPPE